MPKILVLFAHPRLEKSKINRQLLTVIPSSSDITFQDLYELYPDFNIDVEAEKKLLSEHEIIIFMHPFYWYSCPPLLKQGKSWWRNSRFARLVTNHGCSWCCWAYYSCRELFGFSIFKNHRQNTYS